MAYPKPISIGSGEVSTVHAGWDLSVFTTQGEIIAIWGFSPDDEGFAVSADECEVGDVAMLVYVALDLNDVVAAGCLDGLLFEAGHVDVGDWALKDFAALVGVFHFY